MLWHPHLEQRFIACSFCYQTGKGTTADRECCRELVNRHRYMLNFIPSLDQPTNGVLRHESKSFVRKEIYGSSRRPFSRGISSAMNAMLKG